MHQLRENRELGILFTDISSFISLLGAAVPKQFPDDTDDSRVASRESPSFLAFKATFDQTGFLSRQRTTKNMVRAPAGALYCLRFSKCISSHLILKIVENTWFWTRIIKKCWHAHVQKRGNARSKWLLSSEFIVFSQVFADPVGNRLNFKTCFLLSMPFVFAELTQALENVALIEATPLSTPEVFPEIFLSDLPFGSCFLLVRHTFLYMVPLPIQLLRARCASSSSFPRELCTRVLDHNPFETFARPVFSSFLPSESTIDVARCPSLNRGQYATAIKISS